MTAALRRKADGQKHRFARRRNTAKSFNGASKVLRVLYWLGTVAGVILLLASFLEVLVLPDGVAPLLYVYLSITVFKRLGVVGLLRRLHSKWRRHRNCQLMLMRTQEICCLFPGTYCEHELLDLMPQVCSELGIMLQFRRGEVLQIWKQARDRCEPFLRACPRQTVDEEYLDAIMGTKKATQAAEHPKAEEEYSGKLLATEGQAVNSCATSCLLPDEHMEQKSTGWLSRSWNSLRTWRRQRKKNDHCEQILSTLEQTCAQAPGAYCKYELLDLMPKVCNQLGLVVQFSRQELYDVWIEAQKRCHENLWLCPSAMDDMQYIHSLIPPNGMQANLADCKCNSLTTFSPESLRNHHVEPPVDSVSQNHSELSEAPTDQILESADVENEEEKQRRLKRQQEKQRKKEKEEKKRLIEMEQKKVEREKRKQEKQRKEELKRQQALASMKTRGTELEEMEEEDASIGDDSSEAWGDWGIDSVEDTKVLGFKQSRSSKDKELEQEQDLFQEKKTETDRSKKNKKKEKKAHDKDTESETQKKKDKSHLEEHKAANAATKSNKSSSKQEKTAATSNGLVALAVATATSNMDGFTVVTRNGYNGNHHNRSSSTPDPAQNSRAFKHVPNNIPPRLQRLQHQQHQQQQQQRLYNTSLRPTMNNGTPATQPQAQMRRPLTSCQSANNGQGSMSLPNANMNGRMQGTTSLNSQLMHSNTPRTSSPYELFPPMNGPSANNSNLSSVAPGPVSASTNYQLFPGAPQTRANTHNPTPPNSHHLAPKQDPFASFHNSAQPPTTAQHKPAPLVNDSSAMPASVESLFGESLFGGNSWLGGGSKQKVAGIGGGSPNHASSLFGEGLVFGGDADAAHLGGQKGASQFNHNSHNNGGVYPHQEKSNNGNGGFDGWVFGGANGGSAQLNGNTSQGRQWTLF